MQLLLQFLFVVGRYLCNPQKSISSQHTGFKLDRPVLSRLQHQLLSFLIKRGKTTSCFCSPCFSQQFAVPALCCPSEVEWHLQLPPLHSVPPQSFLEKGNAHCSRALLTPPVPKPTKINNEVERYHDICSPRTLLREKSRFLFGCPGRTELGGSCIPPSFPRKSDRVDLQLHSHFSPALWPTGTPVPAASAHQFLFLLFPLSPLLGSDLFLCPAVTDAPAARQLHGLGKERPAQYQCCTSDGSF